MSKRSNTEVNTKKVYNEDMEALKSIENDCEFKLNDCLNQIKLIANGDLSLHVKIQCIEELSQNALFEKRNLIRAFNTKTIS